MNLFILRQIACKVTKKREQNKINSFIFMPSCSNFAIMMAKLRKKRVTAKRFWKINAFRPKIKAIKGKTRNFKLKEKAN